jgi:hypothetical protein
MSQTGSCLFWVGESAEELGNVPGASWTDVFNGQIGSDFTIVGPWSEVPGDGENHGDLYLAIRFFDQDGATYPSLELLRHEPPLVGPGGGYPSEYADSWWVPEETLAGTATYIGTLGVGPSDCAWLDVDGDRYELTGLMLIQGNHIFGRDGRSADIGDQARIEGRLGQAIASGGCSPSGIVVLDIEPAP